jgi:DNA invertase Pin-like site-specific DNA recombinase
VGEYAEIESASAPIGSNCGSQSRQQRRLARPCSAKLDRLTRNVHFLTGLPESGVRFKAVDMPEADKTMIQMMAVLAGWERDKISERTKAALRAAKARGKPLGNPMSTVSQFSSVR